MNANLNLGNQNNRNNGGCCIGNNHPRRTLGYNVEKKKEDDCLNIRIPNNVLGTNDCECKKNNDNNCGCNK